MYTYIYIYRERERYIYIYTHTLYASQVGHGGPHQHLRRLAAHRRQDDTAPENKIKKKNRKIKRRKDKKEDTVPAETVSRYDMCYMCVTGFK